MKRKFKKVLSSVLALALSISCLSGMAVSAESKIVDWDPSAVVKNANIIPDASDNYGVTYFAMVGSSIVKGTYYQHDASIDGYTNTYEYTGSGTVETGWQGVDGLHINRANNGIGSFGFVAEAGKSYVFSANVKDEAADGIETKVTLAMNDTYNPGKVNYIDSYGSEGMVVGDAWSKFQGTITLPSTYPEGGTGYENYLFLGFPAGTATGAKFRLDVSEKDSVYFAEQQVYDLEVTADANQIFAGGSFDATATVYNQLMIEAAGEYPVEWMVVDGDRTAPVNGFTVTETNEGVTVVADEDVAAGDYVLLAYVNENGGMYKGAEFTVLSASTYMDSELPEKAENIIPDATEGWGVTYFAMVDGAVKGTYYLEDTALGGFTNTYEYTGNGTPSTGWQGVDGLHINRANNGMGSFGFVAEAGKSYVFSANVKDEAAEGIETKVTLAMNDTYNPGKINYIDSYGAEGMVVGDDWTKFQGTITLPSTYPEGGTGYENYLFFGFPANSTTGAKFRLDASEKDAVYFAEEQAYDVKFSANSQSVAKGDSLSVSAALVNQIGKTGALSQEFDWIILSEDRKTVIEDFEVTINGNTATITPDADVAEGNYVALAVSDAGIQKGFNFAVAEAATEPEIIITEVDMGDYEGKAWDVVINSFDRVKSYIATFTDNTEEKTGEIGFENVEADGGSVAFAIFLHTQRANVALDIVTE